MQTQRIYYPANGKEPTFLYIGGEKLEISSDHMVNDFYNDSSRYLSDKLRTCKTHDIYLFLTNITPHENICHLEKLRGNRIELIRILNRKLVVNHETESIALDQLRRRKIALI